MAIIGAIFASLCIAYFQKDIVKELSRNHGAHLGINSVPCDPSLRHTGAIGRFISIGMDYTFWG